jgi:hypothetical protein
MFSLTYEYWLFWTPFVCFICWERFCCVFCY